MIVGVISTGSMLDHYSIAAFIIPGSLVLISIILWFFPFSVLAVLTKGFRLNVDQEQDYQFPQVAEFLIILLGLYLLYFVISDAAYWILVLQFSAGQEYPMEITAETKAMLVATALEAIMAFSLILGRKGLLKIVNKVRYGGIH